MSILDNNIKDELRNLEGAKANPREIYQPPYDTNKNEQSYFIQLNEFKQEQYEYNFTLNYSNRQEVVELPTQVLLIINNRLDAKEITLSLTMNINASHLTHLVFIDVYISYFSWIKRYFLSKIQSKEKIKPSKSNNSKGKTSNNINELNSTSGAMKFGVPITVCE